jgi:amino-acid N-acetyltransferase
MITADAVQKLRQARIEDVGGILALIEPLEADGTLVKRNREMLEREIGNFQVLEHDGVIAGCAALYPMPEAKSAELACLAVAPEFRDAGYGERILQACEFRAKEMKVRRLFALTTARRALVHRARVPRRRRSPRCPSSARRSTTGSAARRFS